MYLHLIFDDGTEICVPESDVNDYIAKYKADGYELTGTVECEEGCHLTNDFEDLFALFGVFNATDEFVEVAVVHSQRTGKIIMADAGQF
ncbi:MAG: hypothetical protein H8E28_00435 [Anaerolineae bacterium]|nr:hypothetical protein [Anaerolineae bacterium]